MDAKLVRVLILEDEAAHTEAIARALQSEDTHFEMQVVGSLREYRESAAIKPPDIALLDMVLPDGNALELLTAPPEANAFPMLILTSHGNEKAAVAALQAGALDYIVKSPETFADMGRIVTRVLGHWQTLQDRKRAEDKLRESEARYRNVVELAKDGICIIQNTLVKYCNPQLAEMLGGTIGEIEGTPFSKYLHPDARPMVVDRYKRRMAGEQLPYRYETALLHKDGSKFTVELNVGLLDYSGQEAEIVIVHDVTERKKAEKQRERSLRILQLLNESGEKRELIRNLLEVFKEDGQFEAVGIRLREGDDYPYSETKGFPGEHIWMENRLCAVDDKGRLRRDSSGNPVLECMCGNIIRGRFNPAKPFFTAGGSFWTNSTTDLLSSTTEADRLAITRNRCNCEGYESVALIPLKTDSTTIGLLQINDTRRDCFTLDLIRYYEGLAQSIGIALAEKQIEKALRTSEALYRDLYENAPVAYFSVGVDGLIQESNGAAQLLFGYSREELTGKSRLDLYAPECAAKAGIVFSKLKGGISIEDEEMVYKGKDGGRVYGLLSAIPVLDQQGHAVNFRSVVIDTTESMRTREERKRLEQKAQITSRLAAVGEMAAGVAHEINNPLTGVLGFSQLLLERENVPEELKDDLKIIADGSQRVADIVKRMLTFARQTKPVRTSVNLNEVIDNTLKLRDYVFSTANIKVVTRFDPELPWLVADPGQLQQVFLNLIVNAEQSMKEAHGRGTLTIATEKRGNNIRMSFLDDGTGIARENMEHLFQPFFTTKAPGEGSGLGLSLSRSIIMEHGGEINVESEPGHGAAFIIELPITEILPPEADVSPPATEVKGAAAKKGRVLVVDDEPGVRGLIETVLTQTGYSVDVSGDPKEFLDKLAGAAYDVLFIDVRMPTMSGMDLYARILKEAPAMTNKIIFITGDIMGPDVMTFLTRNNLPYLAKPFAIEALIEKADDIIRAGQPENGSPGSMNK